MGKATVSILGMYRYDPKIFDKMVLPVGINRNSLIDNILVSCAELELLYADLTTLKVMIGLWSKKHLLTWEKLNNTLTLEYNPIENYDRQEEWTDIGTSTEDLTMNEHSNSDSLIRGKERSSNENLRKTNAFNDGNVPRESITDSGSGENESTGKVSAYSDTDSVRKNSTASNHSARIHGNIGVTTSQQMIEAERSVVQFNMIDFITDSFKEAFCLLVY